MIKNEDGKIWLNLLGVATAAVVHAVLIVIFFFTTFVTKQELGRVEATVKTETIIRLENIHEVLREIKEDIRDLDLRQREILMEKE